MVWNEVHLARPDAPGKMGLFVVRCFHVILMKERLVGQIGDEIGPVVYIQESWEAV